MKLQIINCRRCGKSILSGWLRGHKELWAKYQGICSNCATPEETREVELATIGHIAQSEAVRRARRAKRE